MLAHVLRGLIQLTLILSLESAFSASPVASSRAPMGVPTPSQWVSRLVAPAADRAPQAAETADSSAAPVTRAGTLLAEGRAAEAWALLSPLEATRRGDAEFDYLLALAAFESGRAASALAPLRRVLALEPRFDGARLDLARALSATGDAAGARREYQWILERSASATSRAAAQRALAGLDAIPARRGPRRVAAVLAGAGYDSNANASTSESVFGFTLDPRAVEQASPFVEVGASLRGESWPSRRLGLVTLLRAGYRLNPQARFVDQGVLDAGFGLNGRFGAWTTGLGANLATGWLDGDSYFGSAYLEASASRPLAMGWEVAGLGRVIALDYLPDRFEPLDVRRYVWGGALQRRTTAAGIPTFGVALLGGRDDTRAASSPFSNDRYGARLFGAVSIGPRRALFGELSWLTSDYFGARGFLGIDRLDRQVVGAAGLEAREWPARGWRIAPQVRYTDNRSNVALFRFNRFEASVFVRREFD